MLTESGVRSFSGVQNYPSPKMWNAIDPQGRYEKSWNRLGHIQWVLASGEPRVSTPQPDVISVTFDACSAFAQRNVEHVLSETTDVPKACLQLDRTIVEGKTSMSIYEVVRQR